MNDKLIKQIDDFYKISQTYKSFSPDKRFESVVFSARGTLSTINNIKESIKNKELELIKANEKFEELFHIAKDLRPDISVEELFTLISNRHNYH